MKSFLQTPDEVYQELFVDMHASGIWPDGKVIADALPKVAPAIILQTYRAQKNTKDFDLQAFVSKNFDLPVSATQQFQSDTKRPPAAHIEALWDVLTRAADQAQPGGSLIPLPHPYIVPGGRFNEIYYWDSYFTMLGLQVSGRIDLIENMVNNFSYLIDNVGFIPNGNRTYFLGRSQPPFYALMVALLAEARQEEQILVRYLPQLKREYAFWMDGARRVSPATPTWQRVVRLPDGAILNRYWDRYHTPRAEMYATDVECAQHTPTRDPAQLYLDLRAACESGWDFSSRWLYDDQNLGTIRTTTIVPIDLNVLLYNLEMTIAKAYHIQGDMQSFTMYHHLAEARKETILQYCWNEATGFFHDYDLERHAPTDVLSLAGVFPLFAGIALPSQAARVAIVLESTFLCPGGVVTTLRHTGQQWDAPNGWAPLQWITIQGLRRYGFQELAEVIKNRWVALNEKVYYVTGKMLEKYNVEDLDLPSGGGEYPVQDGFGWTNGVLLRLLSERGEK